MICERCGTVFCWDDADIGTLSGQRKRYCSDTCRKHASPGWHHSFSAARKRARLVSCAAMDKPAYPTERAALGSAGKFERLHGERLYPYECPCGAWHLTGQRPDADEKARAIKRALFGNAQ